ncbi:MAG TPA: replication protein [Bacillota bacterium]|nr:replication protein [Bacillota bacterium]
MANPQIENGFIRIANEIWNEIIRRDFSKRQIAILHFIWRLSYGCNKKFAFIPNLKDFELCGIGRTHITKELIYLETCKVIKWNRTEMHFLFNKDYELWQINPVKGWNEEDYKSLVRANLENKISYQKGNSEVTKTVTLSDESYQNSNLGVTETVTSELPKRELLNESIPCGSKGEEGSKNSIKDSIKNNIVVVAVDAQLEVFDNEGVPTTRQGAVPASSELDADSNQAEIFESNYKKAVTDKYLIRRGKGFSLSALDEQALEELLAERIPLKTALEGLDKAFNDYKPVHKRDKINSFNYCLPIIYDLHHKKTKKNHRPGGGTHENRNPTSSGGAFDKSEYFSL